MGEYKMRYIGVVIIQSRLFKCSLDNAKKAFYRCANAIFDKIGRIASEELTLEIIPCKCIHILLYGTEACLLNKYTSYSNNPTSDRLTGLTKYSLLATPSPHSPVCPAEHSAPLGDG